MPWQPEDAQLLLSTGWMSLAKVGSPIGGAVGRSEKQHHSKAEKARVTASEASFAVGSSFLPIRRGVWWARPMKDTDRYTWEPGAW
jgi:hypothetical protein